MDPRGVEAVCEEIKASAKRRGGAIRLADFKGDELAKKTDQLIESKIKALENELKLAPQHQQILSSLQQKLKNHVTKQFDTMKKGTVPQPLDLAKEFKLPDTLPAADASKITVAAQLTQEQAFKEQAEALKRQLEKERADKITAAKEAWERVKITFVPDPDVIDVEEWDAEEAKRKAGPAALAGDRERIPTKEELDTLILKTQADLEYEGYLKVAEHKNSDLRLHQTRDRQTGGWSVKPMHKNGGRVTAEDYGIAMDLLIAKGSTSIELNFPAPSTHDATPWLEGRLIKRQLDTIIGVLDQAKQRGLAASLSDRTLEVLRTQGVKEDPKKAAQIEKMLAENEAIEQRKEIIESKKINEAQKKLNEKPKSLEFRAEEAKDTLDKIREAKAHVDAANAALIGVGVDDEKRPELDRNLEAAEAELKALPDEKTVEAESKRLDAEVTEITDAKKAVETAEKKLEGIGKIENLEKAQREWQDVRDGIGSEDEQKAWDSFIKLREEYLQELKTEAEAREPRDDAAIKSAKDQLLLVEQLKYRRERYLQFSNLRSGQEELKTALENKQDPQKAMQKITSAQQALQRLDQTKAQKDFQKAQLHVNILNTVNPPASQEEKREAQRSLVEAQNRLRNPERTVEVSAERYETAGELYNRAFDKLNEFPQVAVDRRAGEVQLARAKETLQTREQALFLREKLATLEESVKLLKEGVDQIRSTGDYKPDERNKDFYFLQVQRLEEVADKIVSQLDEQDKKTPQGEQKNKIADLKKTIEEEKKLLAERRKGAKEGVSLETHVAKRLS